MSNLKFKVSGKFETNNFQYYPKDYQENFFRPKDVESAEEMKDLIGTHPNATWCLGLRTHDGSNSHINLSLPLSAAYGNSYKIDLNKDGNGIVVAVDGDFEAEVDDEDTLKQLKKGLKNNSIKFSIVEIFMVRNEIPLRPYGPEGGTLKNTDWDDYSSMPQAELIENDIVSASVKSPKPKKPTHLLLSIKANIEKKLTKEEIAPTQFAIDSGIRLNLGLTIPGGLNEVITKPNDFDGNFKAAISEGRLKISIDATYKFKIDSWVKKYAKQSPFGIALNSYWDDNGAKVYLGEFVEKIGYTADLVVGNINVDI